MGISLSPEVLDKILFPPLCDSRKTWYNMESYFVNEGITQSHMERQDTQR